MAFVPSVFDLNQIERLAQNDYPLIIVIGLKKFEDYYVIAVIEHSDC